MEVKDFTGAPAVAKRIAALKANCAGKVFSDIVDAAGNQYVDLVMEGGGVLGIALVGYTYALEEAGIRFLGVGGTSAGSINALLMAALGTPEERKSEKVAELLAALDMWAFVDGDGDAKDFVKALLEDAGKFRLVWKGMQVLDDLEEHLGLNPGDNFLQWLSHVCSSRGVGTAKALRARMATLPTGLRKRGGALLGIEEANPYLALVAADVSTETKVQFPKMAPMYWRKPDAVDPALFVRASMSIPFFFRPLRVTDIPKRPSAKADWSELAGFTEEIPDECTFVDGGIMSNFPIDLFHAPAGMPLAPTFGAKLGADHRNHHEIRKPGQLLGAVFNSARHCLDYDFITRHPDYRKLVTWIDTDQHNWLNFFMEQQEKVDLFGCGVEAAADFLEAFDWGAYKKLRGRMAKVYEMG
jgi:NTE family protein